MSFSLSKCLVTGGAGFIGSHLVTQLVRDGVQVRVLDNLFTGHLRNLEHVAGEIEFINGDVRDADAVTTAVQGMDVVFHQAALASVPLSIENPLATHEVCVTGTVNILNAARLSGVRRVVFAGSSSAYGDSPVMPKREDQVPEVLSPYAAAKVAGEYYCQSFASAYDLEVVRLRYFNVFGPRQDPKSPYSAVIPLFAAALLEGRTPRIYGTGEQSRDFVHVSNVVRANLLAATTPGVSGKVYNVAGGRTISVLELLQLICQGLDCPFSPEFYPPRAGDVLHSWADISAIRQDLGYEPTVTLAEGLVDTLAYYRDEQARKHAVSNVAAH
ncbi:SDR family oxidoreductase [Planctomicrobium piriforme]|uniref:UDP-glucose 4-epimerase n=1 Tax=Planctomicrobium piriforme TaxID=1576369 RepID=A0A1I3GSL1_9PLAN|nr:SDR family oxidoreductase [Planctomicrobium piriforme]SFI26437.1 UDP-glucose 4-epimerase [Planctomicrobium piriforme]